MAPLKNFERIARTAGLFTQERLLETGLSHPFEERNIHESIPFKVRKLFDDAHYSQATFEAAKFVDKCVSKFAGSNRSGAALMQETFKEVSPAIQLTPMNNQSEIDEQKGFQWLFTGSIWAIRNPRGHEFDVQDNVDQCLDHLAFFSMLMRRLEEAGLRF